MDFYYRRCIQCVLRRGSAVENATELLKSVGLYRVSSSLSLPPLLYVERSSLMNFSVLILSSASAVYIKEHTVYDGSDRYNNDDKQQSRR